MRKFLVLTGVFVALAMPLVGYVLAKNPGRDLKLRFIAPNRVYICKAGQLSLYFLPRLGMQCETLCKNDLGMDTREITWR
jgi:hypothetical protein